MPTPTDLLHAALAAAPAFAAEPPLPLWALLLGVAGVGYLLGSIPTAVWLSRAWYKQDIRQLGSGNAGSTNMYRVFGWRAGVVTQVADVGKGAAAAAFAVYAVTALNCTEYYCGRRILGIELTGVVAAMFGHVYPLFAGFRGGKGVNTVLGGMLVVDPFGSAVALGAFGLLFGATRTVSVGSMGAGLAYAAYRAYAWWANPTPYTMALGLVGVGLAITLLATHRSNIQRLLRGQERGFKRQKPDQGNQPKG